MEQPKLEIVVGPKRLHEVALHFRQYSSGGVLRNNGGYTVLIKRDPNKPQDFLVSTARCGKKDNFNRTIGLNIAKGRMEHERKADMIQCIPPSVTFWYLEQLTNKTRERFDRKFFEHLLNKLV